MNYEGIVFWNVFKFTTQSKIIVWFPNNKCLKSPLHSNSVWNVNFITWKLTTQNCLTLAHAQVCVGFFSLGKCSSLVLLAKYFTEKNPEIFKNNFKFWEIMTQGISNLARTQNFPKINIYYPLTHRHIPDFLQSTVAKVNLFTKNNLMKRFPWEKKFDFFPSLCNQCTKHFNEGLFRTTITFWPPQNIPRNFASKFYQ